MIVSIDMSSNFFFKKSKQKVLSYLDPPSGVRHLVPASVENLDITITSIDLHGWIDQIGINNVLGLAECMSKLPSAPLQYTHGRKYEMQHVDVDKKTTCTVSFSEIIPLHYSLPHYDSMSFAAGKLHVEYGGPHHQFVLHNSILPYDKDVENYDLSTTSNFFF
ncbi:hypothetical protein BDF21DRAFT_405009 [Thamnidium elegans]|nr:hypothetical protein BDF21DRAFT_405009 [Thamnidium elegans]